MRVVPQKDSAPLTAKSGNPNMPLYDKQNPSQPLRPTLTAAATAKTGSRPPVTPKLSARPASRQSRSENTTPNNVRDDTTTPASAFLTSNNITSRSSNRKARFESATSTPSATPTPSELPPRLYHDSVQNGAGLGINGLEKDMSKRQTVAFGSDFKHLNTAQNPADSKFFFASEVKPEIHTSHPPKVPSAKRASTFLYANGDKIPKEPTVRSGASTIGEERGHAKFFRANGTPDLQLSPSPHFAPSRPSSVISTASRVTSPRLANHPTSPSQRSGSPQKGTQYATISSARTTPSLPSPGLPRPQIGGRGNSANSVRRTSGDFGRGHRRSTSGGSSMEKLVPTRKISSGGYSNVSTPATEDIPEEQNTDEDEEEESSSAEEEDEGQKESKEPLKAGDTIERMNELAADARRERKVLDLEITNSSLEAINRTLERKMRKQTAELRRYKRLSRSGRFSMATAASSRVASATLSVDGTELLALSDMSEDPDDEFDTSEEDDLEEDGALSPGAVAQNDLKHRQKDEKRLQLDLSKHQQLLVDSQKMNQSLKRCLGWTEELINEGKRALDYKVRISDIPLPPRVLAPPDDGDEGDNEGMSEIGASLLREARKAAVAGQQAKMEQLAVPTETETETETEEDTMDEESISGEPPR
ncbi:hypothetical protein CJF30_00008562 [Rutstroemia sp. NJR-2017a BBW]|nr:hypothetical protein CJF30_00008562 [Rutstroemia sp. NJR-2017a BBW]